MKLRRFCKWFFISSIVFFVLLNHKLVIAYLAALFLWLYFKVC